MAHAFTTRKTGCPTLLAFFARGWGMETRLLLFVGNLRLDGRAPFGPKIYRLGVGGKASKGPALSHRTEPSGSLRGHRVDKRRALRLVVAHIGQWGPDDYSVSADRWEEGVIRAFRTDCNATLVIVPPAFWL
jgi:hypothetical protein